MTEGFDIICLSETFIKRGSESNLKIRNYKLVSSYSRDNERRGGTCILLKNEVDYINLDITTPVKYDFEYCATELVNYGLIIVCIYRTPSSNVRNFLNNLDFLLAKLTRKRNKQLILCGDWNIDVLKENTISKELLSILSNNNIKNHIQKPTRQKSCIDLIVSNIPEVDFKLHYLALSDHETGQSISFKCEGKNIKKLPDYWFENRIDFSLDNIQKFQECLKSLSFDDCLSELDPEKAFNNFYDIFTLLYKLCFPNIYVKVVKKPLKNKWLSKGLKRSCITKRKLYSKYQLSTNDKNINKKKYMNYTKILKKCILQSQKNDNTKFISQSKNICKASWQVIKGSFANCNMNNEIHSITLDNKTFTDPNSICDNFNNYFINLAQIKDTRNNTIPIINNNKILNSIYLTPVDTTDIHKIIKSLKNTNAVGYDNINTKIIKKCALYIITPLTHVINLSLLHGHFPSSLKYSLIKPLYKKGDKNDMNNYRPITLIPVLSKIFEKVMFNKLYNFVTSFNILKKEQFGFKKHSSTTLACFCLVKDITESLNNRSHAVSVFLDLSKAFDFVCHSVLLTKLEGYGIRGGALKWVESYLYCRQQCVELSRIKKNRKVIHRSSFSQNMYGVPQGSVLGPLLFLLYINDLPEIAQNDCILFADDTTLIIKCRNKNDLGYKIDNTLKCVIKYLESNNLSINIDKTKIIQFQPYNNTPLTLNITYNNMNIEEVDSTKFLGLIIDKNCNWKAQVEHVCTKLDKFVYVLRRITKTATNQAAFAAYHGYVSSLLRYGLILWGNSVEIDRVFKVQKKCIRSLTGAGFLDSCKPIFKKIKILPLPCLYIFEICVFVKNHADLFKINSQVYNARGKQKNKLYVPSQRLQLYSNNSYCMAIRIYNHLPVHLKELTLKRFKNSLFKLLLEKTYYSVKEYLSDKF